MATEFIDIDELRSVINNAVGWAMFGTEKTERVNIDADQLTEVQRIGAYVTDQVLVYFNTPSELL